MADLVGIEQQIDSLREWLKDWGKGKKGAILSGPPGVGKTSSVYYVAKELGYNVVEFNASDNRGKDFGEKLYRLCRTWSLEKTLILLDEADGMERYGYLDKALQDTVKPIILTANNLYKIPSQIRFKCIEIRYYRPNLSKILEHVKGYKHVNYKNLTTDFRQAELVALGSQGYIPQFTRKEKLQRYIKTGVYIELDTNDLITLIDNAYRLFYGLDFYWFIRAVEMADKTKNPSILNGFKSKNKIEDSYFLLKIGEMKWQN